MLAVRSQGVARLGVPVRVTVDQDMCVGCESCADTQPDLFRMHGLVSRPQSEEVPEEQAKQLLQAEDACPVGAITVTYD